MLDVAYIFPGQGAQYVGMGEDLYQRYPQAKEIFDCADKTLGFNLSKLIFNGPQEELSKTVNCQVAIFTVSIACLHAFQAQEADINVKFTAGLSLGEYSALVAAEALSFEGGLQLVRKRAQYMEEASLKAPGGMVSVIGLPQDTVEKICAQAEVEVANLNCPGQIVISGAFPALEKARELAAAAGARKAISLEVGGAFHSKLMAAAAQNLAGALEEVEIRSPKVPVISNVNAKEEGSSAEIKDNLIHQLLSRTYWEDSINFISSSGIRKFIEIGPGKVLKGLLRRIDPQLKVYNIGTAQELENFVGTP